MYHTSSMNYSYPYIMHIHELHLSCITQIHELHVSHITQIHELHISTNHTNP